MSREPIPATRVLKLDPETHKMIYDMASWLGVEPGVFVSEAVVAFLHSSRDALAERVHERLNDLFVKLDDVTSRVEHKPVGWSEGFSSWGRGEAFGE